MVIDISASLPALYAGWAFDAACTEAASDGFNWIELWDAPPRIQWEAATRALAANDLLVATVNSGMSLDPHSFGVAANPSSRDVWREEFLDTLQFARRTGASSINVLAGGRLAGLTALAQKDCFVANLAWALEQREQDDPLLLVEPLSAGDRRSPLIRCVDDALRVLRQLGHPPAVGMLFDAYHLHQEEADLLVAFDAAAPYIRHIQVADFPGRVEPGSGEVRWDAFFQRVRANNYSGRIGCEFLPSTPAAVGVARRLVQEHLRADMPVAP